MTKEPQRMAIRCGAKYIPLNRVADPSEDESDPVIITPDQDQDTDPTFKKDTSGSKLLKKLIYIFLNYFYFSR